MFLFTAVLLGLNGLRVSEACATNIEDLGFERGHRTLRIVGKGNKPATVPLVPRTARTIDLAIGECHDGPILRRRDGQRLDRRTEHLRDQPPDGPPVGHGSTLASCMSGRTSTPQYVAAGLRATISKARSRLSQSTIVKLPRYSLASA